MGGALLHSYGHSMCPGWSDSLPNHDNSSSKHEDTTPSGCLPAGHQTCTKSRTCHQTSWTQCWWVCCQWIRQDLSSVARSRTSWNGIYLWCPRQTKHPSRWDKFASEAVVPLLSPSQAWLLRLFGSWAATATTIKDHVCEHVQTARFAPSSAFPTQLHRTFTRT